MSAAARFHTDGWRAAGFSGFVPLKRLDVSQVPIGEGVYGVLRAADTPPAFAPISTGGHFKSKDPTVNVSVLEQKWVTGVHTIYIGKASSLRKRLGQYSKFGNGQPIGHWGGRYIWQLADAADLVVCWSVTLDDPRAAESALIAEFVATHGRLPFANLVR